LVGIPQIPMALGIIWTAIVAAVLLVRRNYRLGRLDVRGAATLATAAFWCALAAWPLSAHHTPTLATMTRLPGAIGAALFAGAVAFVVYAGIDPYARRFWPASLVSWTRLVNGRWRDPLVGQDVLVGVLTGLLVKTGPLVDHLIGRALGAQPGGPELNLTLGTTLGRFAEVGAFSLAGSAATLVLLLLFKATLRRDWLGVMAMACWGGITWAPTFGSDDRIVAAALLSASLIPWVWALSRFGLVAGIVGTWVFTVSPAPIAWNPSLWYGPNMLLDAALILALAAYGCHTALAGRPLFSENLLREGETPGGLA
jgi:hypothetical protein